MAKQTKNFLNYIHYFRGLAIVFIVAVHASISIPWNNPDVRTGVIAITSNGTVLFVFIAGFLFYYLCNERFDYRVYLSKKLKFVILPYLIISIPAILDKLYLDPGRHWWMNETYDAYSTLVKILYMIGTGRHSGILWFIPMIAVFYLLSFLIITFARTKSFNYIVPIICIFGFFTVQFGYKSNLISSFIHFLPVYLIGMWACKFKERIFRYSIPLLLTSILLYVVMSVLELKDIIPFDHYMYLRDSGTQFFVLNLSMVKAIILCLFLLVFFRLLENRDGPVLKILGDYSFGIFFLHLYFINIVQFFYKHHIRLVDHLNLFSYAIYIIVILTICIMAVFLVKRIFKKKSRMLIGS